MRILPLVVLLSASIYMAQGTTSQPPPPPTSTQAPSSPEKQTIAIPAGTRIPLALTSPITTQSRAGNSVRAVTGFPVSIGTRLVIPVGTYVEGVIDKVTKGGRSGASLQMHFTRLVYANGYSVNIDGENTQAKAPNPKSSSSQTSGLAIEGATYNSLAGEPSPQAAPAALPPSHMGAIIGAGVGIAVAGTVTTILLARHRGSGVLFDAGWQFEIILQSPVVVEAASVSAAAPPAS